MTFIMSIESLMLIATPAGNLIDAGLVLYVGLMVLCIWRFFCAWKCCGLWLQYANYCSLLLALVLVILIYDSFYFIQVALSDHGKAIWDTMPSWLRPWVLTSVGFCLATYITTAYQTFEHVDRIKEESAVMRHDRAVQIVLLPAVYSSMALSSMTRMYYYLGTATGAETPETSEVLHRTLSRSETCLWVGDLYEAWALYQFGQLTLEVIQSNIQRQAKYGDEQSLSSTTEEIEQAKAAARGLDGSHYAVARLVWLGILSFLFVSVAESGWSLWLLTFETSMSSKDFEQSMSQFTIAGFLASCAAIYNVFIVEESYHHYLKSYYPRLKFLTVKILVTFAWVQRGFFKALMSLGTMLPKSAHSWLVNIPVIGQFVTFESAQFELFYAALIIFECFLVSVAHYWAWNSGEEWYDQAAADKPLQDKEVLSSGNQSYGSLKASA